MDKRRLLKEFSDGDCLFFAPGKFDDFCVFKTTKADRNAPLTFAQAPLDVDYFSQLVQFGNIYGRYYCWNVFVMLYNVVEKEFSQDVCEKITFLSKNFFGNELLGDKLFSVLYAAMVAEENKEFTVLGKSIKALGVHQILLEDVPVQIAANFSKGRRASDLRVLMEDRGIHRNFVKMRKNP